MAGGDYALGAGQGALGGAAAGAGTGALVGSVVPGPGTAIGAAWGAGIGFLAGGGLGALGTFLDKKKAREVQEALEATEEELKKAEAAYSRKVQQSGAAAVEAVQQGMAAKAAADSAAVDSAMVEAERTADRSGLIGAEKASFVAQTREKIERQRAASSPATYQAALGGARAEQQIALQRHGMGLQSALTKYQTDVAQISGQAPGQAAAQVGQALGSITQASTALLGAGVGGGAKTTATTPLTDSEIEGLAPTTGSTPLTDSEIGGLAPPTGSSATTAREVVSSLTPDVVDKGTMSTGAPSGYLGTREAVDAFPQGTPNPEDYMVGESGPVAPVGLSEQEIPPYGERLITGGQSRLFPEDISHLAQGGIAGQRGPEVAMLGEEGPELVLNAQQTAQLAQALGGPSKPAGGQERAATPRPAAPAAQQAQPEMTPEELNAYLEQLKNLAEAL